MADTADKKEEIAEIRVDAPVKVPKDLVYGCDFKSLDEVLARARAVHAPVNDKASYLAEVRELCFRSKIECDLAQATKFWNNGILPARETKADTVKPLTAGSEKICPECGKRLSVLDRKCSRCGAEV